MSDDAIFPPERFANLMRDAGINSPEALMNMLRGSAQVKAPEELEVAASADSAEAIEQVHPMSGVAASDC